MNRIILKEGESFIPNPPCNSPLLVVLPYCTKDAALAKQLLEYICTTSNVSKHSILLAADSEVQKELRLDMKQLAAGMFRHADSITVKVAPEKQSWPQGPTTMFFEIASHINQCHRLPWLWLEPDATPLCPTWLDQIADAYYDSSKRYMGTFVTVTKDGVSKQHMAGTAVYPQNAFKAVREPLKAVSAAGDAFDYGLADFILPRACETHLIQEIFGSHSEIPTFKQFKSPEDAGNVLTPAVLRPGAVLFHRCKDGSLMRLLQQKAKDDPKNTVECKLPDFDDPAVLAETKAAINEAIAKGEFSDRIAEVKQEPAPKKKQRIGVPESKMATI